MAASIVRRMRIALVTLCLVLAQAAELCGQLSRAIDIRSLPPERALEGVPVKLRAVVSFIEISGTVFLQDETGGTFFRTKAGLTALRPGDVVEVEGVTFPGLYLTGIDATRFAVVGHADPPAAETASFDDLSTGRFHYQKVRIEGVGRRLSLLEESRSLLLIALGGRVVEVRVDAPPPEQSLVDARLRIAGLAAGGINDRRQLVSPYLRVADWTHVEVIEPARPIEELPVTPAAHLLRFGSLQQAAHRVRVRGVVLGSFPGGRLFIRDATGSHGADDAGLPEPSLSTNNAEPVRPTALAVTLTPPQLLQPGQVADVAGFPSMDAFSGNLVDAVVLDAAAATDFGPVAAVPVDERSLLTGAHDADLVTFPAVLTEVLRAEGGTELRLQVGNAAIMAFLWAPADPAELQPGSRVRITGICRIDGAAMDRGFRSRPERVRLWLRSPADLKILEAPTWWTSSRLLIALSIVLAAMLLAVVWIALLRLQVRKQARVLRERIGHEAAMEERQRIAREFHDTLEQELAGLSIRLDAAATRPLDGKARDLLNASRHLVSRIQSEARNLVADLRTAPRTGDAEMELAPALHALAERLPQSDALRVKIDAEGPLPELPAHVTHHLRMMAQEAVTNAIKHGRARNIRIAVMAEGPGLTLSVSDDGAGFDVATGVSGKPGHFGCMGIRERCRKIGAQPTWQSKPGQGTVLEIRLPLSHSS